MLALLSIYTLTPTPRLSKENTHNHLGSISQIILIVASRVWDINHNIIRNNMGGSCIHQSIDLLSIGSFTMTECCSACSPMPLGVY